MKKFLGEFKEFISKGNVLDLAEAHIMVGKFIQNVVNFLIVAFTIFIVVKAFNTLQKKAKKKEEKKEEAPKKADDVLLLEEIRDLLKKQK